jgi:hypothetical protein
VDVGESVSEANRFGVGIRAGKNGCARDGDEAMIDPAGERTDGAGLQHDAEDQHDRRVVTRVTGTRSA